jgi:neutral ceramidase
MATLVDKLENLVGDALRDLAPARLLFGNGRATFAVNRRLKGLDGSISMLPNPNGPTDQDVPVLKVISPEGKLRAVLFGYGCHPVTLVDRGTPVPGYMFQYSGDYAGLAQAEVEKLNPGATALFMQLCAGDQNPATRGDATVSARYGAVLAAEVNRVLQGKLRPVLGNLRTTYELVDLKLRPDSRQLFEDRLQDKTPIKGPILARHAKAMLRTYDEGRVESAYSYPVQGIAWGRDLWLVAMGGEVVVEYALRLKERFGSEGLIVAGYSNDVMAYIPTRQMLSEGGHEVDYSMVVYCHPGPWDVTIEDRVFEAAAGVLHSLGRAPRHAERGNSGASVSERPSQ